MVAKRPTGPAAVQVMAIDGEDRCVDGPVIGHSLQWTEKLPAAGVHRIRIRGFQEHGAMTRISDPWRCRASVNVPYPVEIMKLGGP